MSTLGGIIFVVVAVGIVIFLIVNARAASKPTPQPVPTPVPPAEPLPSLATMENKLYNWFASVIRDGDNWDLHYKTGTVPTPTDNVMRLKAVMYEEAVAEAYLFLKDNPDRFDPFKVVN